MFTKKTNNKNKEMEETLKYVYNAMKEKGYNPIEQLKYYILSQDPSYISPYKDARKKITALDTSDILGFLLENFYEG